MPQNGKSNFSDQDIIKRALRFGIQTRQRGKNGSRYEFVHNVIQIPACTQKNTLDIWEFESRDSPEIRHLSTILFRSTRIDGLDSDKIDARLVVELVVYVKDRSKGVVEMSCGWCECPITDLKSKDSNKTLPINGGSPEAVVDIKSDDIRGRGGISKFTQKLTGGSSKSLLKLEIMPYNLLARDQKSHMLLMPSTCLVHNSLLHFVSGFMNYKAEILLKEQMSGTFRKPSGDVIMANFPKILDSPDIVEEFVKIWQEETMTVLIKNKKDCDVDEIIEKMKKAVNKLYPILYSDDFKGIEQNTT